MHKLAEEAWDIFKIYENCKWLVKPSIPVLYFGDRPSYNKGEIKIVTVALNPSNIEFPFSEPWLRFNEVKQNEAIKYLETLDNYFKFTPYKRWFSSYENLLLGAGSSYYSGLASNALHTDLGSVLATDPTWRKLDKSTKSKLVPKGVEIWHNLITLLAPDIVILSMAESWIANIKFDKIDDWFNIEKFHVKKDGTTRNKSYDIKGCWYTISENHKTLIVFAPAANTPLGSITNNQKFFIGKTIRQLFEGRVK